MASQEDPRGLRFGEFSSHAARESVISLSSFPLPPTASPLTTPPATSFLAKTNVPCASEKSQDGLKSENETCGSGNGNRSVLDFTPTSFFAGDVFQSRASIGSASDFTASTSLLESPCDRFSVYDSPLPADSTCTSDTTLNSLDLQWSSSPSMTRTHKAHHEHLHTGTPASSSSAYSPTAANFPHSRSHIPLRSRQPDIDVVIPSPSLHLQGPSYGYTNTVTKIAKATAAAAGTSDPEGRPPSPLLPPLPSRDMPQVTAGDIKMFGLRGANAYAYLPGQLKVGGMRKPEVEKSIAYTDVIPRVPPRTQDVWIDEDRTKEELFLPQPVPSKIPKPAIPAKSPQRVSSTAKSSIASQLVEEGVSKLQSGPNTNKEVNIGGERDAVIKEIPGPSESVNKPSRRSHRTLLDMISGLRAIEEDDDDDADDDATTTATERPAGPKPLPKHEDSGIAFMSDEEVENTNTTATQYNHNSIISIASNLLASPTSSEFSIPDKPKRGADAATKHSQSLITTLRKHVEELAKKRQVLADTIMRIRNFDSLSPSGTMTMGNESHLHQTHQMLRESKLREAELMAQETELERALTECVAELLEIRMMAGLGEKGHDATKCTGCQKLDSLERRMPTEVTSKAEVKKPAKEYLVSEEDDGGAVGRSMWAANDSKQGNRMNESLIGRGVTAFQEPMEEPEKLYTKTNAIGDEVKEKLAENKRYATIAKQRIQNIKRKSLGQAHAPESEPPMYSAVLEASPTKDSAVSETTSLGEYDIDGEKYEESMDEDDEWLYDGVYANVGRAITTRKELPNARNALPGQEKKIPEGEQLRRTDRGAYSFLDQAPKRSVSPTLLVTKGPSKSVPSLRKGRPLPSQLTRIRPAHEIIWVDHQAPRVPDKHELPRFHLRNVMQKGNFSRLSRSAGANSPGLKREDGTGFSGPRKVKEEREKKGAVNKDDEKIGRKDGGRQVSMVRKMAEAMESQRSSEDSIKTMAGSSFKSTGPKGQVLPPKPPGWL